MEKEKEKDKFIQKKDLQQKYEDKYIPKKFIVKITIIECRNLTLQSGDTPNPYVELEIGGQIFKTRTIYAEGSPKLGEKFNIDLIKTKEEFESLKILFRVWHKTKFYYFYDLEIGDYTVDVSTIAKKTTKMLNNVWGILEHKENSDPGYINYTVVVVEENSKLLGLAPGDFAVGDDDAEPEEEGQKKKNNYADLEEGGIPIELKQYQLTIFIYRGDFAEIDGYTKEHGFKFKVIINQGNPIESAEFNGKTPQWKSEVKFSLKLPCYIDNINIEIYSNGLFLSRFSMEFNRLQKDGMLDAKWYNLYGPYRQNGFMRKIKYAYKYGTDLEEYFYFGRVLAGAKFAGSDNPQTGIKNVSEIPTERKKMYNFWLDIYELMINDTTFHDCELVVEYQVSTQIICSSPAVYSQKTKKYTWKKEDRRFKRLSLELPDDVNQLPFVFVRIKKLGTSIFSSDVYIGYLKFDTKNLITQKEVKPTWNKLRKCETKIDSTEDADNYLGDILCAFNCFQAAENAINKRPVLYDTKSYKKYKLVSIIYMGKNFPLKDDKTPIFCEINFYNNPKFPIVTDPQIKTANPEWNNILFITAMLNEGLELSENIKLFAKYKSGLLNSEMIIGSSEIPVIEVDRYNHQDYIEKEVYKKAKWYTLEHPTLNTRCFVLARFLLVRLIKQESEEIEALNNKKLMPENKSFYILLYIIGVRNLPESVHGGAVQVSYNYEPLEEARNIRDVENSGIKEGKEKFDNNDGLPEINNFNNLDCIQKNEDTFYDLLLSEEKTFLKPLYIEVLNDKGYTKFDTFIDLEDFMKSDNANKNVEKTANVVVQKKKKNKHELPKNQEDYWPIYKTEKEAALGQDNEEEKKKLERIFDITPTTYDASNLFIGEIFQLFQQPEEDKRAKKSDDEGAGNFTRPEVNGEYESELRDDEYFYSCERLRKKDSTEALKDAEILFILDLVPKDLGLGALHKKKEEFGEKIRKFAELKEEKPSFVCRVYLLNVSNVTFDDSLNKENAFFWIKRYASDSNFKQDKKFFDLEDGEINDTVTIPVKWPDTMFIKIEIHCKTNLGGSKLIGYTKINLEKRYFNEGYFGKLRGGIKHFRQIPVESRSLLGEEGDNLSKGALRLWVEILKKSQELEYPPEELAANLKEKYELRIVIWRTRNVPLVETDKVKIQVKIRINEEGKDFDDETDVHHNSKDGKGIFNWRFVYAFYFPKKINTMKLMIYNYNALTASELIGEKTLDMLSLYKKIHRTKSTIVNDRDWIKLKPQKPEFPDEGGDIELEMKILTFQEAEANKVGKGRDEPNKDPFLETPTEGRGFFDRFAVLGNLLSGLGGLYDGIFKILKMFGVIIGIGVMAYVISTLVSVVK